MDSNSSVIKGAKILTLYKQHYLNQYSSSLDTEYSCWGYFDGMDISDVRSGNSSLFRKSSNAAISDVWYETARKVYDQKGYSSQQNIGIFRCEKGEVDRESVFWDQKRIFLSVCFLQLKDSNTLDTEKIKCIRMDIENRSDDHVNMITYVTFDNADMILFLQSNSFLEITNKIKEIDSLPDVVYLHPINSVREESLHNMLQSQSREFCDGKGNLLVNDTVEKVRICIVGNAGAFETAFMQRLQKMEQDAKLSIPKLKIQKPEYSYMTSHENYIVTLENTNMYTVLYMLAPGGILTHNSGLFGSGAIYNMETDIQLTKDDFDTLPQGDFELSALDLRDWCARQMDTYKTYMKNAWEIKDEGLYSYFLTVVQTLNTLSQFENFVMSRNIFYIIYPSFEFFTEQLMQACGTTISAPVKYSKRKRIMDTIQDFLDSINSIIYHSIHMDQIFLMVPGCSGTSYSIPTRLSMFYLWFLEKILFVLNDSDYKYAFYLTPVMESKPYTQLEDFSFSTLNRLICIKVSQRSLFMPRALLLILTHEIAHYAGEATRQREFRLECLRNTVSAIISEILLPYWMPSFYPGREVLNEDEKFEKKLLEKKKAKIYSYCNKEIQNYLYNLQEKTEDFYHTVSIRKILKTCTCILLSDENRKFRGIIELSSDERIQSGKSFQEQVQLAEKFIHIAHKSDVWRMEALANDICDIIIEDLMKEYQEIFADLAALMILKFSKEDYKAAFRISEGYYMNLKDFSPLSYRRVRIITELCGSTPENTWDDDAEYPIEESEELEKNILNFWPRLDFVEKQMKKYLEKCRETLEDRFLQNQQVSQIIEDVQKAMRLFSDQTFSCPEIYDYIDTKAKEYARNVEQQLNQTKH